MSKRLMLSDSKGEKSITVTAFIIGFIIVNLKLLISGLSVAGIQMENFSGSDYAVAVGSLGAIYVMRRATDKKDQEKE